MLLRLVSIGVFFFGIVILGLVGAPVIFLFLLFALSAFIWYIARVNGRNRRAIKKRAREQAYHDNIYMPEYQKRRK